MKTYDPSQVSVIIGGHIVGGFADNTKIRVARDEDAYSLHTGVDGEGTRAKTNNKSGTITISLLQSSESNDVLSAYVAADEISNGGLFSAMIKDNSGTSLYAAETAYIQKYPDSEFSKEPTVREWIIRTDHLTVFIGGNS